MHVLVTGKAGLVSAARLIVSKLECDLGVHQSEAILVVQKTLLQFAELSGTYAAAFLGSAYSTPNIRRI